MGANYWTRERCEALDASDPLAAVRDRFVLAPGEIYLDGNSLGALPRQVPAHLAEVVGRAWGVDQVRGWDAGDWMAAPERIGDKIAPIIGAGPGEVLACDSTTIVLVKLLGAALGLRPGRKVVLTTSTNFPTDLYALAGVARLAGGAEVSGSAPEALVDSLDESVAVLCLTHVDYRPVRCSTFRSSRPRLTPWVRSRSGTCATRQGRSSSDARRTGWISPSAVATST